MAMLKVIILMENKDKSGGIASEKWYLTPTSDQVANSVMNQLREKRVAFMSPGAMVRAVRGEIVDFDADGRPKRNRTLRSVGLIGGGVFGKFAASNYLRLAAIPSETMGGRNTGPTLLLNYVNPFANSRQITVPFCPLGSFADTEDEESQQKFEISFNQGKFASAVKAYYRLLIQFGASQVVRKPDSTPFPIVMATSGDPTIPLLATVTVGGNQTAILANGKSVIVSQRRAKKGLGQQRYKELNGVHTIMQSEFNATTNMTTVSLTCTTNVQVDLCRSAGNIRLAQFSLVQLADVEVFSNARARRSRKNMVQI